MENIERHTGQDMKPQKGEEDMMHLEWYQRQISLCRFRLAIGLKQLKDDAEIAEETGIPLAIVAELPVSNLFSELSMADLPECFETYVREAVERERRAMNACEEFNRAAEYYRLIEAVKIQYGTRPSRNEILAVIDEYIGDSEIADQLSCARGYAADLVHMVLFMDCDHRIVHKMMEQDEEKEDA